MTTQVFNHPPDTLVTTFVDNEVHRTVITLSDLQRLYPQVQTPSGIATIDDPVSVTVCWMPFTTQVEWPKIGG